MAETRGRSGSTQPRAREQLGGGGVVALADAGVLGSGSPTRGWSARRAGRSSARTSRSVGRRPRPGPRASRCRWRAASRRRGRRGRRSRRARPARPAGGRGAPAQARPSGPGPSKNTGPMTCRLPAATAPRWVASWWKYMSSCVVQPPSERLERAEGGAELDGLGVHDRPSAAQTRVRKPWRSTFSARPRRRVIGRWVWRLTSPGISELAAGVDDDLVGSGGRRRAARRAAGHPSGSRRDLGDDAVLDDHGGVREGLGRRRRR